MLAWLKKGPSNTFGKYGVAIMVSQLLDTYSINKLDDISIGKTKPLVSLKEKQIAIRLNE